jgi:hypothetical protein
MKLSEKIKRATGAKAELGALLVDLMGDYFDACADANAWESRIRRLGPDAMCYREYNEKLDRAIILGEVLEDVLTRITGPIDDILS